MILPRAPSRRARDAHERSHDACLDQCIDHCHQTRLESPPRGLLPRRVRRAIYVHQYVCIPASAAERARSSRDRRIPSKVELLRDPPRAFGPDVLTGICCINSSDHDGVSLCCRPPIPCALLHAGLGRLHCPSGCCSTHCRAPESIRGPPNPATSVLQRAERCQERCGQRARLGFRGHSLRRDSRRPRVARVRGTQRACHPRNSLNSMR